jgi:hypothetical protein
MPFFASSCFATNPQPQSNLSAPPSEREALSVQKLWENRQQLDGKVVRVYGFYYNNPPTSALFPDQESFDKKDSSKCLWIGADKPNSKAESVARKDRVWTAVEGSFKNQGAGTFDQFFAQLEDVTDFQVLPGNPSKARTEPAK